MGDYPVSKLTEILAYQELFQGFYPRSLSVVAALIFNFRNQPLCGQSGKREYLENNRVRLRKDSTFLSRIPNWAGEKFQRHVTL